MSKHRYTYAALAVAGIAVTAVAGPSVWGLVARAEKEKAEAKSRLLTDDAGRPVGNNADSRTAGERGGVLLDHFHLIQKLQRFDRERIPERVVHARGAGAHGEFVNYEDRSKYTRAKLFSEKGKKTPVFVRFSTVIHPAGSPESLRDPRGFAVKFYTDEGNWDLVGNNLPVFFIRDAIKFPDFIHSFKPSPVTNQQDPNRQFDFISHVPEATHMLMHVYSDLGTPANYRQMDGFGVHAFKWVTAEGKVTYVKFNWRSMQGVETLAADEAAAAAAKNHSFHTADLYDSIRAGKFPSWELGVQMLSPEDLDRLDFDPLDDTKIWPGVPEVKVGKMTLNRVPANFQQFTEQSAFAPGVMVPGIEPSEDKMLQGRLFSYADTQIYRLGANYLKMPVNAPKSPVASNNQWGAGDTSVTDSDVNYEPSRTRDKVVDKAYEASKAPLSGSVVQQTTRKTQNFKQAGELYRSFPEAQKAAVVKNLSGDLNKVRDGEVKAIIVSFFHRADADCGARLAKATGVKPEDVEALIKKDPAGK